MRFKRPNFILFHGILIILLKPIHIQSLSHFGVPEVYFQLTRGHLSPLGLLPGT